MKKIDWGFVEAVIIPGTIVTLGAIGGIWFLVSKLMGLFA